MAFMKRFTFVLHDETVNTYGFRMLTSGANLEEFRKNPVILLNHKDWELPIGRWENIRIEGTQILADALFDEKDDEAVKIADKVEGGFLRMASMGAWPPEEVSDAAELKLPGQTLPTVTRWTAREASIVTIGANHNALVLFDRQTGKPLDLTDASTVIRLMDRLNHSKIDSNMNKTLKEVLKLQDSAQDAEVIGAVNRLIENNDRLTRENQELRDAAARAESEHKEIRKSEAIRLVDAAIADGRILRHVARHAGLSFNPTIHLARHTFATTVTLTQGVPLETVSKMLGHKRITTTQIYAKITNDKIGQDMAALSEKLSSVFKVAR